MSSKGVGAAQLRVCFHGHSLVACPYWVIFWRCAVQHFSPTQGRAKYVHVSGSCLLGSFVGAVFSRMLSACANEEVDLQTGEARTLWEGEMLESFAVAGKERGASWRERAFLCCLGHIALDLIYSVAYGMSVSGCECERCTAVYCLAKVASSGQLSPLLPLGHPFFFIWNMQGVSVVSSARFYKVIK
jgi:hypothetical protein